MPKHPKIVSAFLIATILLGGLPQHSQATSCPDVEIIYARGSGNDLETSEGYQAFKAAITKEFRDDAPKLSYHLYELGTADQHGHKYPAVSISNGGTLLGAYVGSGEAFAFGASVREGIAELSAYVHDVSQSCNNTKFLLAGYSQGAMVISATLSKLDSDKILYAATFGDPKLYLPEGKKRGLTDKPLACSGKGLSNYRVHVPDCEVESGILGKLDPYQTPAYLNKLGAWCNESDFMCGSYFDFSKIPSQGFTSILDGHRAYNTDGAYTDAAKLMLSAVAKAYPTQVSAVTAAQNTHPQNVAILLDITYSMSSLLDRYKSEAIKIAQKVKDTGGHVALYTYGDELNEGVTPKLLCDYSCSFEQFKDQVRDVSVDGGGDNPESALSGLLHVMNTMSWQRGANKSVVLLTDASYHNPDVRGITLNDVIKRSYEIDPVNIFIITPGEIAADYSELAEQTGGGVFNSADDFAASTTQILDRPYVDIGPVNYDTVPTANIQNLSATTTSDSAHISISSTDASAFYLSLNDAPLGLTDKNDLTLTELPPNATFTLTVTPISSNGRRGEPSSLSITTLAQSPQNQTLTQSSQSQTPTPTPKAPNSGAR